jgi:hypothetical protein
MGLDLEYFIHPERISNQLICPICTQVLDNPVQTPSEHLFCEDELLEWMTRSQKCPLTNEKLDPLSITKPGRIIVCMLAELERYCVNKNEGCKWQGQNDQLLVHLKSCDMRSKEVMIKEIKTKDILISKLQHRLVTIEERCHELEEANQSLIETNEDIDRRLKVYVAFANKSDDDSKSDSSFSRHLNVLQSLSLGQEVIEDLEVNEYLSEDKKEEYKF